MKQFVVIQRKHGVSIHIEDTAAMKRETVNLSWQELAGLHWAMQSALKHPAFKEREPRKPIHRGGVQREYTQHITLVDKE